MHCVVIILSKLVIHVYINASDKVRGLIKRYETIDTRDDLKQIKTDTTDCRRHGGLTVRALDSRSTCPGSSPGWVIVLCSWARHFTLAVPLFTQVYKWVPASLMLGATLRWTSHLGRTKKVSTLIEWDACGRPLYKLPASRFSFFKINNSFKWFKSFALSIAVSRQNMVACYLIDRKILRQLFRDLTSHLKALIML